MRFEYDPEKSLINFDKHGIDFNSAQALWLDSNLLEIQAKSIDEPRTLFIGKIDNKHWAAIVTKRKENIRLISVRRARKNEINLYES